MYFHIPLILLIFITIEISSLEVDSNTFADFILIKGIQEKDKNPKIRNRREQQSLQKIRNHEDCGKIRTKPEKGSNYFQSFLMDLVAGRILERKSTFRGEMPWNAALLMDLNGQIFYCGGAIIDHWHVITSAACVARMNPEDLSRLKVLLGADRIYEKNEPGRVEAHVSQVAYHKGFDSSNMENNIALLKLQKPISYSELIQPICISNGSAIQDYGNALATVSGWGQLLFDPLKSLNKLDVRLWDSKRCIKKYNQGKSGYFPEIRDDSLCAGSPVPSNKNLCQGNNGSPLIIKRHRRFELIGITSWGLGSETFPCVFTMVQKYTSWIHRTIDSFSN